MGSTYLRVVEGIAVEAWAAPDDKTPADCFTADIAGSFLPAENGQVGWTYADRVFSSPRASASIDQMATALVAAATSACAALTMQVVPDQVHQNAYVNAAAMVGPGAVVPTAEPTKSAFEALAASFGAEPAAFAGLVVSIAAVSWQLQTAQVIVTRAAGGAKHLDDLKSGLAAFNVAIGAIAKAINDAGVKVAEPVPIAVTGL